MRHTQRSIKIDIHEKLAVLKEARKAALRASHADLDSSDFAFNIDMIDQEIEELEASIKK